jgi:hypothetical protein
MKNAYGLAVAAIALSVFTGCISYQNSTPQASPTKKIATTATYDVIGDAKGSATGATLFGFIPIGGGDSKSGSLGLMPSEGDKVTGKNAALLFFFWPALLFGQSALGPVEAEALYNAIDSVPSADMLLCPRYAVESSNYIVYSEKTVTVKGKAIRLKTSAK